MISAALDKIKQRPKTQRAIEVVALSALLFLYTAAFILLAVKPELRSLADDGMSYLVMSKVLSPWHDTGPAVEHMFAHELYPPFFPTLIAFFGASSSILKAHIWVICLGTAALALWYVWMRRSGLTVGLAVGALLLFGTSGAWWLHNGRILSENAFILLTFAFLIFASSRRSDKESLRYSLILGLILGLLVLTRTIGWAMVIAWVLVESFRRYSFSPRQLYVIAVPIIAEVLWRWLMPAEASRYASDIRDSIRAINPNTWLEHIQPQFIALKEAWFGFWLPYWEPGLNFPFLMISGVGVLALAGWLGRLFKNHLDAWYVLLSFGILILWPHPGQMPRFLIPLMPFLIAYALLASRGVAQPIQDHVASRRASLLPLSLVVVLAVTEWTGLGFYIGRYHAANPIYEESESLILEYYRPLDFEQARRVADLQLGIMDDMKRIESTLEPNESVYWFTPGYIALLANRRAHEFPRTTKQAEFIQRIVASDADYCYLTRFNPRNTRQSYNGLKHRPLFSDWTTVVWQRRSASDAVIDSVLLKINR